MSDKAEQDGDGASTEVWSIASSKNAIRPAVLAILFTIACYLAVIWLTRTALPKPDRYEPSAAMPFNLTNAMHHIRHLGQKKRYVSSHALEDALQYVYDDVTTLTATALENGMRLDVDFFRSGPGSFETALGMTPMRHSYNNVSSVIARLRPANLPYDTQEPSLLINAHVDSAISSPGVSDNLAAVGITMDVLRAVASMDTQLHRLSRPIIFLFNGAEEVLLHGAHSFVSQHEWGRSPATHINLESIGSGAAYYLFRIGPHAPWLARAYAKAVSYPFTSVTANEVFNSRIIPAETDFQVFDAYGNIPGYDFALIDNGYIYHTTRDDIPNLDEQGVLHGGITVFELAMHMAGRADAIGAHLANPHKDDSGLPSFITQLTRTAKLVQSPKDRSIVFFDITRRVMLVYSETLAAIMHTVVLTVSVTVWLVKVARSSRSDLQSHLRMCGVFLACLFASFASATFASLVYTEVFKAKLVWYGSTAKAMLLFCPPIAYGTFSALLICLPKRLPIDRFDHMLLPVTGFYSMFLAGFIWKELMSSYIPAILLTVIMICVLQGGRVSPISKHVALVVTAAIVFTRVCAGTLSVMLPLMGRVRTGRVPNDTVAGLLMTYCIVTYVIVPSLPVLCYYAAALRRLRSMTFVLAVWIATWFLLVAPRVNVSGVATPYSSQAPKRMSALHFHAPQMDPSSIVCIASHDSVEVDIERIARPLMDSDVGIGSMTGVPTFGEMNATVWENFKPYQNFLSSATYFRSARAPRLDVPTAEVLTETVTENGWNVSIVVRAADSNTMSMRFDVGEGSALMDWSFNFPLEDASGSTWIRHSCSSSIEFWVFVRKIGESGIRPQVRFVVGSMRLGTSRSAEDLAVLNFRDWESPNAVVSTAKEMAL